MNWNKFFDTFLLWLIIVGGIAAAFMAGLYVGLEIATYYFTHP